jgi:signal transduction histidine kinase
VDDEVDRLERMLDDLLRHARPTPNESPLEPEARIPDAVATALQLISYRCRERGVEVVTALEETLPAIALAEDALKQLLLNLLLNASEITPAGASIRISAGWSPQSANQVELSVEDGGPGIDGSARSRIFEPFWTTRKDGAGGLGLSICKKIVDEAGGSIDVEPGRDQGARFRISLPIAR